MWIQLKHALCVGLARTMYLHRVWPYVWWFPCQKYRIHTVCMYGFGQPYLCQETGSLHILFHCQNVSTAHSGCIVNALGCNNTAGGTRTSACGRILSLTNWSQLSSLPARHPSAPCCLCGPRKAYRGEGYNEKAYSGESKCGKVDSEEAYSGEAYRGKAYNGEACTEK